MKGFILTTVALIWLFSTTTTIAQNVGVGIDDPLTRIHIAGQANPPLLLADSSHAILRVESPGLGHLDIGKFPGGSWSMWIQAGYNSLKDPIALQPLGGNVGIGTLTPDLSAALDLSSANSGLLVPRLTHTERDAISNPADGLLVYVTTDSAFNYYNGDAWSELGTENGATGTPIDSLVDADHDTKVHVEGLPDDDRIRFDLGGTQRWVMKETRLEPKNSGRSVYIGDGVAQGVDAGNRWNVAIGDSALANPTPGQKNIAIGYRSLSNSTNSWNTAIGHQTMPNNTSGQSVAIGYHAGLYAEAVYRSVAVGFQSLANTTDANHNVGVGFQSLSANTTGELNTAVGSEGLNTNTTGSYNTAIGYKADVGSGALTNATAIGANAQVTASNSLVLGNNANVGIGIKAPGGKLSIYDSLKTALVLRTTDNTTDMGLAFRNSGGAYTWSVHRRDAGSNNADLIFAGGVYKNNIDDLAERFTIRAGGAVGIGEPAPTSALHISRTGGTHQLFLEGALASGINNGVLSGVSAKLFIKNYKPGTDRTVYPIYMADGDGGLDFYVRKEDGTPTHTYIAGKVGIGTTTPTGTVGSAGLAVTTGDVVVGPGSGFFGIYNGGKGGGIVSASGTGNLQLYSKGTWVMGIDYDPVLLSASILFNGYDAIKSSGGMWLGSSDRRLKSDIEKYEAGLDELLRVNPVRYNYNKKSGYDITKRHVGVIAQEVEEIAPYMISTREKDGEDYLMVDASAFTYMLINAVQELAAENEQLKRDRDETNAILSTVLERLDSLESGKGGW